MLIISTKTPTVSPRLDLGGGAALIMRKAESLDIIAAEGEAIRIAAAIDSGAEAVSTYFPELAADAVIPEQRRVGMVDFLTEVELAMIIVSATEGIVLDDVPQTAPSRILIASLFREIGIFGAFRRMARIGLHERTLLGNGSARSLTGGPPAAPPIADPAASSASLALPEGAVMVETSAPNASTET